MITEDIVIEIFCIMDEFCRNFASECEKNLHLEDKEHRHRNRKGQLSHSERHKGMTFSQFVTRYRLNTACGLLRNSRKSISEIGYLSGFNDPSHFIRSFTKEYGMSPGKYRKSVSPPDNP